MNKITAKICIGIPTYKRPEGLKRLLLSLAQLEGQLNPHIIVADNEGIGAGSHAVSELQRDGYPYEITVIPVYDRGISQARNALLEAAFVNAKADYLCMVDDDVTVDKSWLIELISVQKKTNADVVSAQVKPIFEPSPPAWTQGLRLYYRKVYPDGLLVKDNVGGFGTTSILINKSVRYFADFTMHFDEAFSLTGGGDEDLFSRLRIAGGTFAYASRAIAYENYPASRMTRRWAINRSIRVGAAYSRVLMKNVKNKSLLFYGKEIAKCFAGMGVGLLKIVCYCWHPAKSMSGLLLVTRQIGKIKGLLGDYGKEYSVIHGR